MKVTVRVDVERHIRDEAARQLAEQGLTIGDTVRIVLEQAAAGYGPELGALVPNLTTLEAIEAARRGRRARQPGRGDRRAQPGRLRTGAAGQPARAVDQAGGSLPARLQMREAGRARPRVRCAGARPHRFPRAARAVTPGK